MLNENVYIRCFCTIMRFNIIMKSKYADPYLDSIDLSMLMKIFLDKGNALQFNYESTKALSRFWIDCYIYIYKLYNFYMNIYIHQLDIDWISYQCSYLISFLIKFSLKYSHRFICNRDHKFRHNTPTHFVR